MSIYIALLAVLIIAILFAVFKRVDGFVIGAVVVDKDTTVEKFLNISKRLIQQDKAIKKKLDTSAEFDDTLSEAQLKDLDLEELKDIKPVSKALSQALEKNITMISDEVEKVNKKIDSGDLKSSDSLEKLIKAVWGSEEISEETYKFLDVLLNRSLYVSNNREEYVNSKVKKTKLEEKGLDMEDLYGALSGSKKLLSSEMEDAPEMSSTSTKEMEERIAKNVATQLKDNLLARRATQNVQAEMPCPYAPYESDATAQGKEFTTAKPSPTPDMSEYIRKDSIPCWNCSLP